MSEPTKSVFTEVDEAGFEFVRCEILSPAGEPSDRPYWLCDAIRTLELLDEKLSNVRINHDGRGKFYNMMGVTTLVFRPPPPCVHVFRMTFAEWQVVCDARLRNACKQAKLRGFRFVETK